MASIRGVVETVFRGKRHYRRGRSGVLPSHLNSSVDSEVFVSPTEISLPPTSPTEPPVPTPETNVEGPSVIWTLLWLPRIQ